MSGIEAAAIGGLATLLGGASANRSSARSAERATQASSEEAAKSRAHQLYMSNTSYQRAMADMKASGLNPMLAFQQGGASTGSGATASGVASKFDNAVGEGANSALATRRLSADLDKIAADTKLSASLQKSADADTLLKGASTAKTLQEAKKLGFDTERSEFKSLPSRIFNSITRGDVSSVGLVPKVSDDEYRKAHPSAKFFPFGIRVHKKGK